MARLIRTEYIEGLQQILTYKDTRIISDATLERLHKAILAVGEEHVDAVAQEFPPKVSLARSYSGYYGSNIDWKTPREVRDEADIWEQMYREVLIEQDHRRRTARSQASFERLREHARVQLAWANDLATSTVNLQRDDFERFHAGLEFVKESGERQS